MKRILLVDNELRVYSELRRMMHPLEARWQMAFASNGADALKNLADEHYDILISSARVRDMDGSELFSAVRMRYPTTLRVLFSAPVEAAEARRYSGEAHQRLSKGAAPETIQAELLRGCALHDVVHSERIASLVDKLDTLPSMPSLYLQFVEACKDPNKSVEDIGSIIAKDIALTAKVLQIVNSASFGLTQKVLDPGQAATFLGLDLLRSLVLSVQAFNQFDDSELKHFTVQSVWGHSMRVANFARAILETERSERNTIDAGFLAGMMHDCGKLVLAKNRPERFEATRFFAERDNHERVDVEQRLFGASHAQIGGHLMAQWGLPSSVIEAVAFHHDPSRWNDPCMGPLAAVHVANVLARLDLGEASGRRIAGIDYRYLKTLGREASLPAWIAACIQVRDRDLGPR